MYDSFTYNEKTSESCNSPKHNFQNPLYGPGVAKKPSTLAQCHDQYPLELVLDVPNPFYKEFRDPKSETKSDRSSWGSLEQNIVSRPRLDTFPYVMDDNNSTKLGNRSIQQNGDRIEEIVYECVDTSGKPCSTITSESCTMKKSEYDNLKISKISASYSNVQASQQVDLYDYILTRKTTSALAKYDAVVKVSGASKVVSSNSPAALEAAKSDHLKCTIQIQEELFDSEIYTESIPAIKQQPPDFDDADYVNTG